MLEKFNLTWPNMKPLKDPIYGKLILFAGAETPTMQDSLYRVGIRNILVSFHYLRKQNKDKIRERLSQFEFVMLDSGAFTIIQRMNNGEHVDPDEIKQFTHDYIEFCTEMSDCFNWCVEMDVADKVSPEFYRAQQDELLARGIRVLPVVHGNPIGWYKDQGWLERFDAVAIAGRLTGGAKGSLIPYLNEFRKAGILVHGLAATDTASIERMPYFSCDSTTWLSGGKFGSTYIFRNGTLVTYDNTQKSIREKFKNVAIENGIDWDLIKGDKSQEVNVMNALHWRLWQDHIKYDTKQSYWLTDVQMAEAKEKMAAQRNWTLPVPPTEETKAVTRSGRVEFTELLQIGKEDRTLFVDPRSVHVAKCNTCSLAFRCDHFDPADDARCVYKVNHAITHVDDLFPMMGALLGTQMDRIQQERLNEIYDGNRSSKELTNEMKAAFFMAEKYAGIKKLLNPAKSNLIREAMSNVEDNGERKMRTITGQIVNEVINES